MPHVYFMPASSLQAEKMADLEDWIDVFWGAQQLDLRIWGPFGGEYF